MAKRHDSAYLTTEELEFLMELYGEDFNLFASECLKIADKDKNVIPLVFRSGQLKLAKIALHLLKLGVPLRFIDLKARQEYHTTFWVAFAFWLHYFAKGPRQTDLMGDMVDRTNSMKEMFDRFYENLPTQFRRPLRGQRGKKRLGTEQHWILETGAHINMHTALTPGSRPGQGTTSSSFIATECPYYKKGGDVLTAIMNAMPDKPGTLGVKEGTSAGAQGEFYISYVEAIEHTNRLVRRFGARDLMDLLFNETGWGDQPDGFGETHPNGYWDGSWLPLFQAWFEHDEYVRDPRLEGIRSIEDCTKEERQLMKLFNLGLDRIAWRRYAIAAKCDRDPVKFKREYPGTWEEAFTMGGSNVFNPEIVQYHLVRTKKLARKTVLDKTGTPVHVIKRVEMNWLQKEYPKHAPMFDVMGRCINPGSLRSVPRVHPSGRLLVRWVPRSGWVNRYVIGVDISEGLAQGDYSVATVLDRVFDGPIPEFAVPAMLRAHIQNQEDLADQIAMLSLYYHGAHVLVEINKESAAVIGRLGKLIPGKVLCGVKFQKGKAQRDVKKGWTTTGASKPVLVGGLTELYEEYGHNIPFADIWGEAMTFTREPSGEMGAEGKRLDPSVKNYDDTQMSLGIARQAHHLAPPPKRVIVVPESETDVQKKRTSKVLRGAHMPIAEVYA